MKVDILIKTTVDVNLNNYKHIPTITTVEEAIAWEVDEYGVMDFLEEYSEAELFLVDVKPSVEEKNELSIMAERMSKELPDG